VQVDSVIFAPGHGAFFYDDQAAIRAGASLDGFAYRGRPVTPGFQAIRVPARSLGIGLVLSDGEIVWGDMMSVQYSGASGRDPLFDPSSAEQIVQDVLWPRLSGLRLESFRDACASVFTPTDTQPYVPLAVRYGMSQALLRAVSHARRCTMAELICNEYGLPLVARRIPVFSQSGDAREINVDKMILKQVDVLPHGLINAPEKFGAGGDAFREFVLWVAERIRTFGTQDYRPTLHFDVYGWMGFAFDCSVPRIAAYIAELSEAVAPFRLHIECPADFGSRAAQIEGYARLVEALEYSGSDALIVVDERCNTLADVREFAAARAGHIAQIKMPDVGELGDTVEAVLACRGHGMGAYVGGSCAETDLSARASVHVAVATQADMMLAKPGMGVDEGFSIVTNEQSRLLRQLQWQAERSRAARV
jgi:methylaspartate ammonia-lyase